MSTVPGFEFKIATEEWEFEQIHQLNYRTFVEEIPQHEQNPRRILVDKFHPDNTYFVCVQDHRVVGMICVHDKRPFSLDHKLDNLDAYLPPHRSLCEVRLLSIDPKYRRSRVLIGLLKLLERYALDRGYDLAVMSGLESQQHLYRHLGWVPFGPLTGASGARFQPMYLTLEAYLTKTRGVLKDKLAARKARNYVNLLPGPVSIPAAVQEALASLPESHRSDEFLQEFILIKRRLCQLTSARFVEIFMGSGTLANDVIAGQLSLLGGRGIVLSNGEFGRRLINHARRWGLNFEPFEIAWGDTFDEIAVENRLKCGGNVAWLWATHCETSTGVMNDLGVLTRLCARRGVRLCLDCVSSIGAVPLNLEGIYLASGVSGKGLRAYPGLSMVFYNHGAEPAPDRLPCCLDLGYFASKKGVPFTISSNLVYALSAALGQNNISETWRQNQRLCAILRSRLRTAGFEIIGPDAHASPFIITFVIPKPLDSRILGQRLEQEGFLVSFNSEYLLERNWMQAALMSAVSEEDLGQFCALLESIAQGACPRTPRGPSPQFSQVSPAI